MRAPEAEQAIRIEKRDSGVALATLNRPDKRNAVGDAMRGELARLPRDADADPEVRVLLITGAGRAFCAGGDFAGGLTPSGESGRGSQGGCTHDADTCGQRLRRRRHRARPAAVH